jgi:hypothetical protein
MAITPKHVETITFINQLMHSVITVVDVQIYVT